LEKPIQRFALSRCVFFDHRLLLSDRLRCSPDHREQDPIKNDKPATNGAESQPTKLAHLSPEIGNGKWVLCLDHCACHHSGLVIFYEFNIFAEFGA